MPSDTKLKPRDAFYIASYCAYIAICLNFDLHINQPQFSVKLYSHTLFYVLFINLATQLYVCMVSTCMASTKWYVHPCNVE